MIIDFHTHAWPLKVSQKARAHLETFFKVQFVGDPTIETLLAFMDKNGIAISIVCAVATKPEQVPSINEWLSAVRQERVRVFAAMHPAYCHWQEELTRIKAFADGIKMQPEFQDFNVDDERVYPLYEQIAHLGLPLLFHCGEELSGTQVVRSSPARLIKVKRQFPRLKIVAAHFGGFRLWNEVKEHLLGEDVYLDTSFFFGFLSPEETKNLLVSHRPDRLLFGTDFPLVDQKKDLDFLRDLDIPEGLKERILCLNAQQLLRLSS